MMSSSSRLMRLDTIRIRDVYKRQVFDGELDATDVFVSLISQKYGKINTKEYLAKKKDMEYNEDEVQKSQIPSGLCG